MLVQKSVVFGVSLTEKVNSSERSEGPEPKMAGMTPISGLQNAFDADYDPTNDEVHN